MKKEYSVLMSVYYKERPEYLMAALNSILNQTIPPYEIVLVCDGALTDALEQVIKAYGEQLTLVRLPENVGLGKALAEGLRHCSCEWIARMDSDDIAADTRCEKQLEYIFRHPDVDVLSGVAAEFAGDALTLEDAKSKVFSYKCVPEKMQEIEDYIKYRNPINHPCAMFRKSKVLAAGNYQMCYLFEDYDLWVRMYQQGCVLANLTDTILYMRVNDMHKRRGGIGYAKAIIAFRNRMYQRGLVTLPQHLYSITLRVIVSLLPNGLRKLIYDKKLRNR